MFSGIVECLGYVIAMHMENGCKHLTIKPTIKFDDLNIGDSVSINGICLTVTHFTDSDFNVTVVPETLRITNLDSLQLNDMVNLERSIKLNSRIGGHCVQGHVDGQGEILEITTDNGTALLVKIALPERLAKYVVNKGYITLDGMSITVIESTAHWFTVTFIPHTQEITTVHQYHVGRKINIEVDIFGKYVEKIIGAYQDARAN
jgi:riboflavin synthase